MGVGDVSQARALKSRPCRIICEREREKEKRPRGERTYAMGIGERVTNSCMSALYTYRARASIAHSIGRIAAAESDSIKTAPSAREYISMCEYTYIHVRRKSADCDRLVSAEHTHTNTVGQSAEKLRAVWESNEQERERTISDIDFNYPSSA